MVVGIRESAGFNAAMVIVKVAIVLLVIGVGAIFALMWASTAFASLYHAVDLEDQARLNQNGVPVAA